VERSRERRVFNRRKCVGGKCLVGAVEDELKLRELERLRQKLDLPQQQRLPLLKLADVDGQRLGRPYSRYRKISFRKEQDQGQQFAGGEANLGDMDKTLLALSELAMAAFNMRALSTYSSCGVN
jgi:hypothetical protein